MEIQNKATRIDLFSFRTPQMRAFHMSWFAFLLCFFSWFGIAPLMVVVREEFGLTKQQIGNTIIASVAITILGRLFIGWLCDRIGPRLSYTFLLTLGSLPVMGIGLSQGYESFLLFRLAIGMIGASFVITQYHTSVMFAPNCVGTANATSAGWGNLGGGVTQIVMPLILAAFLGMGVLDGVQLAPFHGRGRCGLLPRGDRVLLITTDLPNGNFKELRASGEFRSKAKTKGAFGEAVRDKRVWALFGIYAACFGIELTINNIAALYYADYFGLGVKTAGLVAGLFGLMNVFARTLGGFISDKFVEKGGLRGRVKWLFIGLLIEGIALIFFSQMRVLVLAIPVMIVFSLFVQMSEGATFSVVPFINKRALGAVAGIVGAGGNMGAVAAGFLIRAEGVTYGSALLILGCLVVGFSFLTFLVRFSPAEEAAAREEYETALAARRAEAASRPARKPLVPALAPVWRNVRPMDLLRIYLGIALVIKGIYFVTDFNAIEATLAGHMPQWQNLVSWGVVFAHVVGGAALALGFVTRVAAAANALVVAGAVGLLMFGSKGGFGDLLTSNVQFQFTVFVLFTLVLLVWRGSGPFSLDRILGREPADPAAVDLGA